jgi:hypothetical protein
MVLIQLVVFWNTKGFAKLTTSDSAEAAACFLKPIMNSMALAVASLIRDELTH